MESYYAKRALTRDPSVPIGQPTERFTLSCECGRTLDVRFPSPDEIPCPCGIVYSSTGWILKRP